MLNLLSILEQYGLTALGVADLAGQARTLATAYSIQPNYVLFTSRLRQLAPGLDFAGARQVYNAARYFAQQGQALSDQPGSLVLPPEYAQEVNKPTALQDILSPYGYTVTVGFKDPNTGTVIYRSAKITRDVPGTLDSVLDEGQEAILEAIESSDPFATKGRGYKAMIISRKLTIFTRYVPGP